MTSLNGTPDDIPTNPNTGAHPDAHTSAGTEPDTAAYSPPSTSTAPTSAASTSTASTSTAPTGSAAAPQPAAAAVPRRRPLFSTMLWGALMLALAAFVAARELVPGELDLVTWLLTAVVGIGLLLVVAGIAAATRRAG